MHEDVVQIRDELLMAALPDVAFDGWTWEGIEAAAQKTGHDPEMAKAVFPEKMVSVMDGFSDLADRKMLEALQNINPEDLRIRDRVRTAVWARLEWLAPHREAVKAAAGFWAWPTRKPKAAQIIWRTADLIWDWAGDTAQDYNRYTKRILLTGIITTTMLAWFDDDTLDMSNTADFLDRRIGNVMQLGKVLGKFKKAA